MNLRSVAEILPETRVIMRVDLDLPIDNNQILDNSRLVKSLETIRVLLQKNCRVLIIGHRGRPTGFDESLSLRPVYVELMSLLEPRGENFIESVFVDDVNKIKEIDLALGANQIVFLENLRFWEGEEKNEPEFLEKIKELCQFYVNDAFGVAHRKQASIMLWEKMPGFYGLSFIEEVNKIEELVKNPQRPLTIILGGAKKDKLDYLEGLVNLADRILIGGKLPTIMSNDQFLISNEKIKMAELREDKLDLSDKDIESFIATINSSKTIIWAGAMGFFEDDNSKKGTVEIARALINSQAAYKVIAGGDTSAAVRELGLEGKIDYVSSGGGVMLEFLTKRKLAAFNSEEE
jgi:phosphoglycerate kinase